MSGYILKIDKGATFNRTIWRRDKTTKAIISMVGWTVKDCKILTSVDLGSVAVNVTTTVDPNPATGKIYLSLTLDQVETLPSSQTLAIYLNITHASLGTVLVLSCPVQVYAKGDAHE